MTRSGALHDSCTIFIGAVDKSLLNVYESIVPQNKFIFYSLEIITIRSLSLASFKTNKQRAINFNSFKTIVINHKDRKLNKTTSSREKTPV